MFDTIDGLPLHPLVVHGVVVLLPLGILGTIAIALRPAWRRRYGVLVVGITAIATALIPVATESGQEFKKRVGDPGNHQDLGELMLWFALPLLVLVLALVVLDRRTPGAEASSESSGSSAGLLTPVNVVAALALVAGVAAGVHVFRVGDSGARAAWEDIGKIEIPSG